MRYLEPRQGLAIAAVWLALVAQPAAAADSTPALANRLSWGVAGTTTSPPLPAAGSSAPLFAAGNPPLPPAAQAQIDAMRITREPMPQTALSMAAERRAINQIADPEQKQAALKAWQQDMNGLLREAQSRSLLRDLYSPAQLQEQMTWFWFNHFNVDARKREIRAMVGDYEDVLRAHAFGRFRDLLEATLQHPAMLQYLDNDRNAVGHINENYAREIMELHSMGVGSGYSQQDVQELARILTGVGVRVQPEPPRLRPQLQGLYRRDGLFEFNPARHDFGDKKFLGHHIRGRGFEEVRQALDLLAASPATATHVSRQIAQYMLGAPPSAALVARMAERWQATDGRISAVLQTLFQSAEFRASLGQAFKDPMHYVVSAVRYAYGDGTDGRVILNTDPMLGWLNRMGQSPFLHQTPDGYPLDAASWTGPGQMETRFEIARIIGGGAAGLFRPSEAAAAGPPAMAPPQNARWTGQAAVDVSPQTRAVLDRAAGPGEWNMLYLASPEFMRR